MSASDISSLSVPPVCNTNWSKLTKMNKKKKKSVLNIWILKCIVWCGQLKTDSWTCCVVPSRASSRPQGFIYSYILNVTHLFHLNSIEFSALSAYRYVDELSNLLLSVCWVCGPSNSVFQKVYMASRMAIVEWMDETFHGTIAFA